MHYTRTRSHTQAVFLLIGKTSALTMNIAGVIKDWMLIFFSYSLFHAPVTRLNLLGYIFCCSGVSAARAVHTLPNVGRICWYAICMCCLSACRG